ncbi:MAG TPA: cytochrome c [Chromatiales bacterium]|nr:cytochrome c [Chromatiales bacterium]
MKSCHKNFLPLVLGGMALLTACDSSTLGLDSAGQRAIQTPSGTSIIRKTDQALVSQGQAVFEQHCATCHGDRAQGDPQWRKRGPDGLFPPPPLDGSGHAWHHPTRQLREMISNGSPPGQGKMPAWGDKLTSAEIDAVIAWFQSLWPDPVYAAWFDREQRFQ